MLSRRRAPSTHAFTDEHNDDDRNLRQSLVTVARDGIHANKYVVFVFAPRRGETWFGQTDNFAPRTPQEWVTEFWRKVLRHPDVDGWIAKHERVVVLPLFTIDGEPQFADPVETYRDLRKLARGFPWPTVVNLDSRHPSR